MAATREAGPSARRRGWAPRLLIAAGLLIAEYLLISLLFDARRLTEQAGGHRIVGYVGDLAVVAMVGAFATLAFRGPSLRADLAAMGEAPPLARSLVPGVLHGVAYGVFLWLTRHNFEAAGAAATPASLALWALVGLGVATTLLLAAVPPSAMRALIPRVAPALAVGLLAGALVFGFGRASEQLWAPLGRGTLATVVWLLEGISSHVLHDMTAMLVGYPGFVVEVAHVCSGFEGIGLITAFLGGYMMIYRRDLRFPHALIVLPLGIVCVWVSNVIRIAALVMIGHRVSPAIALGGFHSKAGWLFFCIVALGFIALTREWRWLSRDQSAAPAGPRHNPTLPYLLPLLVLIAFALITGLWIGDFDTLYPVRIVATVIALWLLRKHYRELGWGLRWEAIAIGVGVFVFWALMVPPERGSPAPAALGEMGVAMAGVWLVFRALGSTLVIPLVEELAFRGYLLRRLQSADFMNVPPERFGAASLVISSLAFGFLHTHWVAGALAGAAYAFAQRRHGKIADAVVAHAVTNGLITLDVLILGAWGLW